MIARAGAYVVGLDPETGIVCWKHFVADTLDGFVLEVCGDVALTDLKHEVSKHGHVLALDGDGKLRWDLELASAVDSSAFMVDDRSFATAVLGQTWEIVIIDANGSVEHLPLPYPGSYAARTPDGSWVVGSSGLAIGKPSLFVVSDNGARPIADAAPQVVRVLIVGHQVITVERTGERREVVARGLDLQVRWRNTIANEIVALTPGQLWCVTGERAHPAPTAFDIGTGEVRWQGATLTSSARFTAAAGDLVLIAHRGGAVLLSASGAMIGEHDGRVGRIDVTGDAVHLFVDGSVVCLERP